MQQGKCWRASCGDLAAGEAVTPGFFQRAHAIAERICRGVWRRSVFDFVDEGGADYGGVGETSQNGNMAGQ